MLEIRSILIYIFLILLSVGGHGQNIDSLKNEFYSNRSIRNDTEQLELIYEIAKAEDEPDSSSKYSRILIDLATKQNDINYLLKANHLLGSMYRLRGDYDKALEHYFKSISLATSEGEPISAAMSNIEIGNVYSLNGNAENADIYYSRGIETLRAHVQDFQAQNTNVEITEKEEEEFQSSKRALGGALYNTGDEYLRIGNLEKALELTNEAEIIFHELDYGLGQAYSLGNLGRIYAGLGNDAKAEANLNSAIILLQDMDGHNAIADFLLSLSNVYLERGNFEKAIQYAKRSLDIAKKYGYKNYIADANLKLSEIYEKGQDTAKSFQFYKDYITYRDSSSNVEAIREMANLRTDFEVSQKQAEVDLLSQQKRNQKIIVIAVIVALILIMLLAIGLYRRNNFIRRTTLIIEKEKNRSEHLLRNILPEETALELKETGKVQAKKFEAVSVLFTDFEGFTHFSESLSPEELVETVDFYFSKFDKIIEKFGLEKIKTVGDSYMCAAGVPFPMEDHAQTIILAAMEILDFVKTTKERDCKIDTCFEIRIGINSGPVIAGVVGSKKFAYDIWGDTVNVASRMESCSEIGKINISEYTYSLVNDLFICEDRGELEVKNRGMMNMYFVKGIKGAKTFETASETTEQIL